MTTIGDRYPREPPMGPGTWRAKHSRESDRNEKRMAAVHDRQAAAEGRREAERLAAETARDARLDQERVEDAAHVVEARGIAREEEREAARVLIARNEARKTTRGHEPGPGRDRGAEAER